MKKAIVTGGAGFVGSNLIKKLLSDGVEVLSIDNYLSGYVWNHHFGARYEVACCSQISEVAKGFKADVVFHLGEYSRVEQSMREPIKCLENTTKTLSAVLEYCTNNNSKIIYSGSSTKFGDANSVYIMAKRHNTETVKFYAENFNLDYAITYFYNVYGENEISEGKYATVIAKFLRAKNQGDSVNLHAPATQVRNLTHINDIVSGLILVAKKGHGDNYGIGNDQAFSIKAIAEMIGVEYEIIPSPKGNRLSSALNTQKTKTLGWKAKHNLKDYLESH